MFYHTCTCTATARGSTVAGELDTGEIIAISSVIVGLLTVFALIIAAIIGVRYRRESSKYSNSNGNPYSALFRIHFENNTWVGGLLLVWPPIQAFVHRHLSLALLTWA